MIPIWSNNNVQLIYTDTEMRSLIPLIKTDEFYNDIKNDVKNDLTNQIMMKV